MLNNNEIKENLKSLDAEDFKAYAQGCNQVHVCTGCHNIRIIIGSDGKGHHLCNSCLKILAMRDHYKNAKVVTNDEEFCSNCQMIKAFYTVDGQPICKECLYKLTERAVYG